jgi:predicted nucleotidyltransferase
MTVNMTVQGIAAEYNPFHNGHRHHIQASIAETGATHTVCVLSGHFVQRGEPSVCSKAARTEMALRCGVDLVLELPAAFSCASAESFAAGAVTTLGATGIVDAISFGSEEGSLPRLEAVAGILAAEPEGFRTSLRIHLDEGMSFPSARQAALSEWMEFPADADVLGNPNNILGIEYLKALRRCGSSMKPCTVPRVGRGYHDPVLEDAFPSATAIRLALAGGEFPAAGMPAPVSAVLRREIEAGRAPVSAERFLPMILQRLRTATDNELASLPWMEQGLHNRLRSAAADALSFSEIVDAAATARYPRTRVQRMLCALLTGMTGELAREVADAGHAQYIRVLGFTDRGRELLAVMRRKATLPIIGKSSQWGEYRNPLIHKLLDLENRASDTWALACRDRGDRQAGQEHRRNPLYMRSLPCKCAASNQEHIE